MFSMKIEKQMNMSDRTILLGSPKFDEIPNAVSVDGKAYKVIGLSSGVKPPFVSLEIEKTDEKLIGKTVLVE